MSAGAPPMLPEFLAISPQSAEAQMLRAP